MVERRVAQPTGLQLSSLAQPHITEIAGPQRGHTAAVEPTEHGNAKPAVLLDDQSTITGDPLFDFSGRPISSLNVAFGGGHGIDGEQFDLLVPNTVGQSTPSESDAIPPSSADFRAASVDALPVGARPLALLGHEGLGGLGNALSDAGGGGHRNLAAAVVAPGGIVIPAPGGQSTTVFEAGLGPRPGEPAGSHAGQAGFPTTTKVGAISFTSVDGVQKIELGGLVLTPGSSSGSFTDATGRLTASFTYDAITHQGTVTYHYTLLDNTLGTNPSFAVAVTDADGDRTVSSKDLIIKIEDDKPTALADADTVVAGQSEGEIGNVLTSAGTASVDGDIAGADGSLQVVGVAAGNTGADLVNPITIGGAKVFGTFGGLQLFADGSYTYTRHFGFPGGADGSNHDIFTYTIRDADGSLSHTTLEFTIEDSAPSSANELAPNSQTAVFEAGLANRSLPGSHPGDPAFPITASGTILVSSMDGVSRVLLGGHVLDLGPKTFSDGRPDTGNPFFTIVGILTASYRYDLASGIVRIDYSYTLDDVSVGDRSGVAFDVSVTDLDGDTGVSRLSINVIDDAPTARGDSDSLGARQSTPETGNVITGEGTASGAAGADIQGADGVLVVGVVAGVSNLDRFDPGTVGVAIAGNFGRLTLDEFGNYSFNPSNMPIGGVSSFTYTIRDIDGDMSHATITFTRNDIGRAIVATTETDGVSADHFIFNAPTDGGAHILDFRSGTDSIDVLLAGFSGLSGKGAVAASDFVISNNASIADLGKAHFAYNASTGELFYDSNGGDASGTSRILLAVLDHHAAIAATDIHKI